MVTIRKIVLMVVLTCVSTSASNSAEYHGYVSYGMLHVRSENQSLIYDDSWESSIAEIGFAQIDSLVIFRTSVSFTNTDFSSSQVVKRYYSNEINDYWFEGYYANAQLLYRVLRAHDRIVSANAGVNLIVASEFFDVPLAYNVMHRRIFVVPSLHAELGISVTRFAVFELSVSAPPVAYVLHKATPFGHYQEKKFMGISDLPYVSHRTAVRINAFRSLHFCLSYVATYQQHYFQGLKKRTFTESICAKLDVRL